MNDTKLCARALADLIASASPWRAIHARHSNLVSSDLLLKKVFRGSGAFESLEASTHAFSLLTTFASHFERVPVEHLDRNISFLFALQDISRDASSKDKTDEIAQALYSSASFWEAALAILKRPQPQPGPPKDVPPAEPLSAIIGLIGELLSRAERPESQYSELIDPFVQILLEAGLFDAISNALPILLTYTGLTSQC